MTSNKIAKIRAILSSEWSIEHKFTGLKLLVEMSDKDLMGYIESHIPGWTEWLSFNLTIQSTIKRHVKWSNLEEDEENGGWDSDMRLNIQEKDLRFLNLKDEYLRFAVFERSNLSGGTFVSCQFAQTEMALCDLRDSMFIQCPFSGTDLQYCDLRGADFSTSLDLHYAKMVGAVYNDKTKFPEGFDPEEAGLIKFDDA